MRPDSFPCIYQLLKQKYLQLPILEVNQHHDSTRSGIKSLLPESPVQFLNDLDLQL